MKSAVLLQKQPKNANTTTADNKAVLNLPQLTTVTNKTPFKIKQNPLQLLTAKREYSGSNPLQFETNKENKAGIPDDLKTGIETLSGFSMDDVTVYYNSGKPAALNALAYAQGTNIYCTGAGKIFAA